MESPEVNGAIALTVILGAAGFERRGTGIMVTGNISVTVAVRITVTVTLTMALTVTTALSVTMPVIVTLVIMATMRRKGGSHL